MQSDRLRKFRMQVQNITQVAVVTLRPKVRLFLGIDELGCNSYSIADSQNRAFDDCVDLKLAADLAQWLAGFLVKHGGGTRDDAQFTNFGKGSYEGFR